VSLRIAVDLVFFTGRKGGTETVARGLYPALAEHGDLEFVGIGDKHLAADPPPWFLGEIVGLPVDGENRPAWAAAVAFAARHAPGLPARTSCIVRRTSAPRSACSRRW
jgi:hypothetical protein